MNSKRKLKGTVNDEINKLTWEWFVHTRSKNIPLSGPIVQAKAKEIAASLNNETFKGSNGWLESFKFRHNIVWNSVCGEANDVNITLVEQWKEKIRLLVHNYEPCDIYNGDETGLFFRAIPSKTLCVQGDKCIGGKQSKERLTIFLCSNMTGSIEKPMVIGKAAKPRCFKNLYLDKLPVIWKNNKKAWNTAAIMEEWLKYFDAKMRSQNRKVILFMDNATCHPDIKLKNVELAWFPANTSSVTQPLDQGVIRSVKIQYRKSLLCNLIANIDNSTSVSEVAKKITVLDAVMWLTLSVKAIEKSTVTKCFEKAGFQQNSQGEIETNTTLEDIDDLIAQIDMDVSAAAYINIDAELSTYSKDFSPINYGCELETAKDETEDLDSDYEELHNYKQVLEKLKSISIFALKRGNNDLFTNMAKQIVDVEELLILRSKKQTKITEFFNK